MVMKTLDLIKYPGLDAGKNVRIKCREFKICGPCSIGDNVEIEAEKIFFGRNVEIEANTTIKAIDKIMDRFIMGDQTFIGAGCRILAPFFKMLDYSQLHNHCLVSGYKPANIGYNCWIGQHSILNSTEVLTIQNNVRIGTYSQLWTHVASGELLEGCTLFGAEPLTLEDNVWLVGGAVVSPGLTLKKNSIIMTGSVVTKSTKAFHTYAGVPAKDITTKLNGWEDINLDDKFEKLIKFIREFTGLKPQYKEKILIYDKAPDDDIHKIKKITNGEKGFLLFAKQIYNVNNFIGLNISVFDLHSKRYIKKSTTIEIDWVKFCVGYRARFIPFEFENCSDPITAGKDASKNG